MNPAQFTNMGNLSQEFDPTQAWTQPPQPNSPGMGMDAKQRLMMALLNQPRAGGMNGLSALLSAIMMRKMG